MTHPLERRRFLALAGMATASLAGCAERLGLPGSGPEPIDGDRLAKTVAEPVPSIPKTLPVAIESSFVTGQMEVARGMLADVPAPFDSETIPNGAIRERLNRRYHATRQRLRGVGEAETPLARLHRAGSARADAREVRATWRAIDAGLTVEAVRDDAPEVRGAIDAFASRWTYVGDDPIRSVRVHAAIEDDVRGARNWTATDERHRPRAGEGPFAVGEAASRLERARVDVDTATYLFERFRRSLAEETALRSRLETTRTDLRGRVREGVEALPDAGRDPTPTALVDRDVGQTAGVWALSRLYERVNHEQGRTEDEAGPALGILDATWALVVLRAFEHLRARIEEGDDVAVASAEDVAALRAEAISAIQAARETERTPGLVEELLPRFAREVGWTDDQFDDASGELPVESVERDAAPYVIAAETCDVLPDVCAMVATRLRA